MGLQGDGKAAISGILFDLDGTLVDIARAMRVGVQALHTARPDGRSLEEFAGAWRAADKALDPENFPFAGNSVLRRARIREVYRQDLDDAICDELFEIYRQAQEREWRLYDDVLSCLDALTNVVIGVVSNGDGSQQRAKLTRTGILDRFRCVVVSGEVGVSKPERAIFGMACDILRLEAHHVIYIGDRYETDALGARRAGLRGVWLDRSRACGPHHEPPVISSLSELAALAAGATP